MIIEIPDKKLRIEFPDDMSHDDITKIIQRDVYGMESPSFGRLAKKTGYAVRMGIGDVLSGFAAGAENAQRRQNEFGLGLREAVRRINPAAVSQERVPAFNADKAISSIRSAAGGMAMPERFQKPTTSGTYNFVEDAITGLAGSLPAMVATNISPPAGIALMYEQILGGGYNKRVKAGADPDRAYIASALDAAAQAPLEYAGTILELGALKKMAGGKAIRYLRTVLQTAAAEGLEEGLQAIPEKIADIYAANPKKSNRELAKMALNEIASVKFAKEAGYQAAAGAVGGGLLGAGGGAVQSLRSPNIEVAQKDTVETRDNVADVILSDLQSNKVTTEELEEALPNLAPEQAQSVQSALATYRESLPPKHGRGLRPPRIQTVPKGEIQLPQQPTLQERNQEIIDRFDKLQDLYDLAHEAGRRGDPIPELKSSLVGELTEDEQSELKDSYESGKHIQGILTKAGIQEDEEDARRIFEEQEPSGEEIPQGRVEPQGGIEEGEKKRSNRVLVQTPQVSEQVGIKKEQISEVPPQASEPKAQPAPSPVAPSQKEPWEITRDEYITGGDLPKNGIFDSSHPPEETGYNISAVRLDNGIIYYDKSAKIHSDVISSLGIPPERVVDGGFIVNGEYKEGSADSAGIGEQNLAKRKVEHRLAVAKAYKEGNQVPQEVLKDYPDLVTTQGQQETPNAPSPINGLERNGRRRMASAPGVEGEVDRRRTPRGTRERRISTPEKVTEQFNAQNEGSTVKFDGIQDLSSIGKPPLYQFTGKEGILKGASFSISDPTVETLKAKVDEMTQIWSKKQEKHGAIGRAWTGNQWKPITDQVEIKRGKNKGKMRVTFAGGKKRIVAPESIKPFESTPAVSTQGAEAAPEGPRAGRPLATIINPDGRKYRTNGETSEINGKKVGVWEYQYGGKWIPVKNVQKRIEADKILKSQKEPPTEKLKKKFKDQSGSSQIATDIINHGISLKQKGIKSFRQFKSSMREKFSEVWDKIKVHMRELWGILNNEVGQVDVWHGSPHRFEKFSTEKIGTGEGAQAFGWGLYFTDQKSIAEHYGKNLSQYRNISENIKERLTEEQAKSIYNELEIGYDYEIPTVEEAKKYGGYRNMLAEEYESGGHTAANDIYDSAKKIGIDLVDAGKIYKATLHEGKDPSEYSWLDWDKNPDNIILGKIIEQAKKEDLFNDNKSFMKYYIDETELLKNDYGKRSGQILYDAISDEFGKNEKEASLFLLRSGIDGIRYPAGTLSGGGKGTNYVVFDENAVTIKEINVQLLDALKNEKGSSELVNDIVSFGSDQIKSGVSTLRQFNAAMRERFSNVWNKIRQHMRKLFDILMNQRGEIKIGQEDKSQDIINRYFKKIPEPKITEQKFAETKTGPVPYSKTIEPITEQDYIENRQQRRDVGLQAKTGLRRVMSEIAERTDKFLGAISTRLGNINPKLKAKLRKLDFDINTKMDDDIRAVEPLLKKAKTKMNRDDFLDFDYARKNSDSNKIKELSLKYNLKTEYDQYRKTLDKIRKEAIDVGLAIGEIEEYAPRVLKDSRGFLNAIGKEEDWPIYTRRLKEKANDLGISITDMSDDMKADIISNMILFGQTGLGGLRAEKQRKIQKIPPELNKFYMDSDAALVDHIYRMRKGIEARKFFGKIPEKVSKIRKQLRAAETKLRDVEAELKKEGLDEQTIQDLKKKRNRYYGNVKEFTDYIDKYAMQRDYRENIGQYVLELIENGDIKARDERAVNEILNARFHEKGTHGIINAYKNMSYIDTMGSPISALTQIGDLAWAAYDSGMIPTIKNALKALRGKSKITKEDVGVERIAQEFADASTLSRAVSFVFKMVQLERIDSIGKETLLNSALEKYQKQAKENPERLAKEVQYIFENETQQLITDLQDGKITDNVKLLVYNRLLDFQPVALSEMPEKYLNAGNGRIFYMLKTFTLKQFDAFRNEAYLKIKNGNRQEKIQGMKNLIKLAMFFVLANATADELKDFVLGRSTDWQDRLVDNALRLFGISKFITWQARTEGVGTAIAKQILPPFKFLNAATKDIVTAGDEKGLEVVGSIPLFGKLYYWHLGRGSSKRTDLWERRYKRIKSRLESIKNDYEETTDKRSFMDEHLSELRQSRKISKYQGRLNRLQKEINILKKRQKSNRNTERIEKLQEERIKLMRKFVESYKQASE